MSSKAALLWDESYLWGLAAYRALTRLSLDFRLVTADDIRQGALEGRRLLYVPGGWASNKLASLKEDGARRIREFVQGGGSYIGVCGGAGLATSEGLGLLRIRRKPLEERVPSLSGKIRAKMVSPHPFWEGINGDKNRGSVFHIWWPSQFEPLDPSIKVVAAFEEATPEAFSSDLNVGSVSEARFWEALEAQYGINLDPGRMRGEPLALEGACGRGRVFLTLIHPDTPRDPNGARVLQNLWMDLGGQRAKEGERDKKNRRAAGPSGAGGGAKTEKRHWAPRALLAPMEEFFTLGRRNFLWFKDGWIARWRRGVRGLEYFTLYEHVRELAQRVDRQERLLSQQGSEDLDFLILTLANELHGFAGKAGRLLALERMALQRGVALTFSKAPDAELAALRTELFGGSKRHGGEFKEVLNKVDGVLYRYLKDEELRENRAAGWH